MIEKTFPITEKLLQKGLVAAQNLLALLHKEAENLAQKTDPILLKHIAAGKEQAVGQLDQFIKQLAQVLATENLVPSHEGIHQYLSKARAASIDIGDCQLLWDNITALSKKCRSLNEQNGASIELLSRHTQRALDILKGKSQTTGTYGPDGAPCSEQFSHTLISV